MRRRGARYVDGWRAPRAGRDIVDLDGGRDWVCAVHRSGELSCWGSGSYERGAEQPVDGDADEDPGAAEVVTLSLGTHSACYINAWTSMCTAGDVTSTSAR